MNARSAALKGAVAACCLMASACTNPNAFETNYAEPIGGAPVLHNPTPYTEALYCMGEYFRGGEAPVPYTISVGKILDYTGKDDIETGRRLTQGAALMAMSALGKAGIPQVERFDTSVTELEIKFADNQLIGDQEQEGSVRRLIAGEIPGSGYHLIGGITELNYNIRSNEGEVLYDIVSLGARYYVMNIGLDLRLVHTKSLRVIETVSYQKQIIGRELKAGLFEFFDGKLLDLGLGERSLEPMQLAVRSVIERAVFELMRNLHHLPKDACEDRLYGPDLHLAGSVGKVEPKEEKQEAEGPRELLPEGDASQVRKS
ncbi:MAG: holdfast anchoring protein HfaB [Alphaproteobacteria bacterium]